MDVLAVAVVVFATLVLGGVLLVGLVALFRVRNSRRERLQMKQHLRRTGLSGTGMGFDEP